MRFWNVAGTMVNPKDMTLKSAQSAKTWIFPLLPQLSQSGIAIGKIKQGETLCIAQGIQRVINLWEWIGVFR